jgi:siroheme synthase
VVCTLEGLAKEPPEVKPPAVMVVGKVVNLNRFLKEGLVEGLVR